MLRYFFYQLLWSFSNYVLRNPHARRAAKQGCLALLLAGVALMLVSVTLSAIAGVIEWATTTPTTAITLLGICAAVMVGVTTFAIIARPAWRKRLSDTLRSWGARFSPSATSTQNSITTGAAPALPLPEDLDKIRVSDDTEYPGVASVGHEGAAESDEELLNRIVIHEEE